MRKQGLPATNGFVLSRDLNPKLVSLKTLSELGRQTHKHPPTQIKKLVRSLKEWGFVAPIIIDASSRVVAGWGLIEAARALGLTEIPAVVVGDLPEAQLRALRHALNRLSQDAHWDVDELALEFNDLLTLDPEIDLTITGFEMGEIDTFLSDGSADEEDDVQHMDDIEATARPGDLFQLGSHRILCGDATKTESYERLMGDERAQMVITDPPYNVPIPGNVSGLGTVRHQNFQMASGEMSPAEFVAFLTLALGLAARFSSGGAIHDVFMDWRHQMEIVTAGRAIYSELKNVCVWTKSHAAMGSLYRSQHELVYVFKVGTAPHINNIQLGRFGRNRSNVWPYAAPNTLASSGKSKLAWHPTVKPLGLIADAIRDCSNQGGLILDPFGGAGTTLIAAEKTGRSARLLEIEPRFVDVTIARWQRLTGQTATLIERTPA